MKQRSKKKFQLPKACLLFFQLHSLAPRKVCYFSPKSGFPKGRGRAPLLQTASTKAYLKERSFLREPVGNTKRNYLNLTPLWPPWPGREMPDFIKLEGRCWCLFFQELSKKHFFPAEAGRRSDSSKKVLDTGLFSRGRMSFWSPASSARGLS